MVAKKKVLQYWDTLTLEEQRLLICFMPFKRYINLGEPLIVAYLRELRRFKSFRTLPTADLPRLIQKCTNWGWLTVQKEFTETEMMLVNPVWSLYLNQISSFYLSAKEIGQVEKAFVRYYKWMGYCLYGMFAEVSIEKRIENLSFLSLETDNLRLALQIAVRQSLYDITFILLALNAYLDAISKPDLSQYIIKNLLTQFEAVPEKKRNDAAWYSLIYLYDTLGGASLRKRDYEAAVLFFRKAIAAYHAGNQQETYPQALGGLMQNLASALSYQEKWGESEVAYQEMLRIGQEYQHKETEATYYLNYGFSLVLQRRYGEAIDYLKTGIEAHRALNLFHDVGLGQQHLATALIAQERFEEAAALLEESMDIFTTLGDTFSQANVWDTVINLHLRRHNFEEVKQAAHESMQRYILNDKPHHQALVFQTLAVASIGLGDLEEGKDYLNAAADLYRQLGDARGLQKVFDILKKIET